MKQIRNRKPSDEELFFKLRFEESGCDPLNSMRSLNFTEQLNQSFTYLVTLTALEKLFKKHTCDFQVNLGTSPGFDIHSQDNTVFAEVFAVVSYRSNGKLKNDIKRLSEEKAEHKYVFFYSHAMKLKENEKDFRKYIEYANSFNVKLVEIEKSELFK